MFPSRKTQGPLQLIVKQLQINGNVFKNKFKFNDQYEQQSKRLCRENPDPAERKVCVLERRENRVAAEVPERPP